jgi:hypothetical protein
MRFEANTPEGLVQIKQEFINALAPHFDHAYLRQELGL